MDNNTIITPGEAICKIILVEGYSLILRSDAYRKVVNDRLQGLNFDGGVHVQVIVDKLDKLAVLVSSHNHVLQECMHISEGINNEGPRTNGQKSKRDVLCDGINKSIININRSIMTKSIKKAANVVADEREKIVRDLVKIIMLCNSDVMSLLMKYGEVNPSEICRKMTSDAINSVQVEDGVYVLAGNSGISQTINSGGHSEKYVKCAISSCVKHMMEFCDEIEPLSEETTIAEFVESAPEKTIDSTEEKNEEGITAQAVDSVDEKFEQYNREVKIAIDSVDKELDTKERSSWTMLVRSMFIECASRVGLVVEGKKSLRVLVELMTDENKEKVRELHSLYGFKLPVWLRDNVRTKVK